MDKSVFVESSLNKNNLLYSSDVSNITPLNAGPACVSGHGEDVEETKGALDIAQPSQKPARPC